MWNQMSKWLGSQQVSPFFGDVPPMGPSADAFLETVPPKWRTPPMMPMPDFGASPTPTPMPEYNLDSPEFMQMLMDALKRQNMGQFNETPY